MQKAFFCIWALLLNIVFSFFKIQLCYSLVNSSFFFIIMQVFYSILQKDIYIVSSLELCWVVAIWSFSYK